MRIRITIEAIGIEEIKEMKKIAKDYESQNYFTESIEHNWKGYPSERRILVSNPSIKLI